MSLCCHEGPFKMPWITAALFFSVTWADPWNARGELASENTGGPWCQKSAPHAQIAEVLLKLVIKPLANKGQAYTHARKSWFVSNLCIWGAGNLLSVSSRWNTAGRSPRQTAAIDFVVSGSCLLHWMNKWLCPHLHCGETSLTCQARAASWVPRFSQRDGRSKEDCMTCI